MHTWNLIMNEIFQTFRIAIARSIMWAAFHITPRGSAFRLGIDKGLHSVIDRTAKSSFWKTENTHRARAKRCRDAMMGCLGDDDASLWLVGQLQLMEEKETIKANMLSKGYRPKK